MSPARHSAPMLTAIRHLAALAALLALLGGLAARAVVPSAADLAERAFAAAWGAEALCHGGGAGDHEAPEHPECCLAAAGEPSAPPPGRALPERSSARRSGARARDRRSQTACRPRPESDVATRGPPGG